jgi:hypothetical protein
MISGRNVMSISSTSNWLCRRNFARRRLTAGQNEHTLAAYNVTCGRNAAIEAGAAGVSATVERVEGGT